MPSDTARAPVQAAAAHLERLAAPLFELPAARLADARLASARPEWPSWPQPALAALVGPPPVIVDDIDLTWLHRFSVTVGWLDRMTEAVGGPGGGPSALSLLVERAAMLGHRTWGAVSAGGSARIVEARDGWLAVNLPRDDDLASVAAWLESPRSSAPWELIEESVGEWKIRDLVDRAGLLGLPVGTVPAMGSVPQRTVHQAAAVTSADRFAAADRPPRVIDCSSLWAGPLCGWYLARAGAHVVKVESSKRPDGARAGTPAFWKRLNGNKALVELDLTASSGVEEFRRLIAGADIVIEGSRPRAMRTFGIDAAAEVARGAIWCSITGYGRASDRVAFGDDAAVAGGLVGLTGREPWFIGDAAADPISGVTAAAYTLGLWVSKTAGLVDVSMADAVGMLTGGRPVPLSLSSRH